MTRLRRRACMVLLALLAALPPAVNSADTTAPLRFGILPLSGPLESRTDWQALLDAMSQAMGQPVEALSVGSYEALAAAIARQEVDIAFLSGKMALIAVTQHHMHAVAQAACADAAAGYRALLLARKNGPVTRDNLLTQPGTWRLARGSSLSMSGYVVPYLKLFLANQTRPEHYFLSEHIGTHQNNALAVANGEADIATGNSVDMTRFRARFPREASQIDILWESEPIPHAFIVAHNRLPRERIERLTRFLFAYGRTPGEQGDQERNLLRQRHALDGFAPADNSSLEDTARLNYQLAAASALSAQWVNQDALDRRLARLKQEYERQQRLLQTPALPR